MSGKLSFRTLLFWWVRLCLFALPVSVTVSILFTPGDMLWYICTGLWLLCFLLMFLVYYPIKYHRLCWRVEGGRLTMNSGAIYWRTSSIEICNIQYVTLARTPVGTAFRLATVNIWAAGGWLHLPGLTESEAQRLCEALQ